MMTFADAFHIVSGRMVLDVEALDEIRAPLPAVVEFDGPEEDWAWDLAEAEDRDRFESKAHNYQGDDQ